MQNADGKNVMQSSKMFVLILTEPNMFQLTIQNAYFSKIKLI